MLLPINKYSKRKEKAQLVKLYGAACQFQPRWRLDHGRPVVGGGDATPFQLDSPPSLPLLVDPSQPLRTEPSPPPPRAQETVLARNDCHRRPPWLLPPPLPKLPAPATPLPPRELPSELMSERLSI